MRKVFKRTMPLVLAFAMTASLTAGTASEAAAKKASLATKKITITKGKSKTIKIKNKKKKCTYTFSSKKKAIATVSKTGKVKAKKVGTTKIVVKEVKGKKKRNLGAVKVTVKKKTVATSAPTTAPTAPVTPTNKPTTAPTTAPTVAPTVQPTVAPTTQPTTEPTTEPTATPAGKTVAVDLSTYTGFNVSAENCMYDTNTGIFNAKDQEYFGYKLAQSLVAGESVTVHIKGTNNGAAGFRSWLVDATTATCCANPDGLYFYTSDAVPDEFKVGDFDISYTLTANAECEYLFIKGASYGVNIEDLSISSIDITYPENKEIVTFTPTQEQNEKMISDSLMSTGNNARIKNVIAKAKAGEDVTIAYIGGSVTEGQGASPNSNCYAEASCKAFADQYGTGSNVHFVNAGMSGTPSSLGIIRYDRDVLGQMASATHPDILFVEFSVNDSGECTNGGAYEGIIRRALASGSAVVLQFSVFRDNWNMQDTYKAYGEKYDLPMVSMKDAIATCYKETAFTKWYFSDSYHPTNEGYKLTSDSIMNLFEKIDAEEADTDNITNIADITPVTSDAFTNTTMLGPDTIADLLAKDNSSLLSFDAGGFSDTDTATGTYLYDSKKQKFETNWKHSSTGAAASMTAKVNCKNLMVVYKLSNDSNAGTAELYVDGKLVKSMNSYNKDGWNNATTELAFNEETAKEHTIEIKMAAGSETKDFTLLAMGYN